MTDLEAAQREVDALTPGSPPIAPVRRKELAETPNLRSTDPLGYLSTLLLIALFFGLLFSATRMLENFATSKDLEQISRDLYEYTLRTKLIENRVDAINARLDLLRNRP